MTSSYCVRCKKSTASSNPSMKTAKNGRKMMQSTCATCSGKKTSFVAGSSSVPTMKKHKGKGLADILSMFL